LLVLNWSSKTVVFNIGFLLNVVQIKVDISRLHKI